MTKIYYFDNAATTFPKPECVYKALDFANRNLAFNSGRGIYSSSKQVYEMIQDTKNKLGKLIDADSSTISFESSATESLNLIIYGLDLKAGDHVYISPFEHNAIVRPLYNLQSKVGFTIHIIPFDKQTWEVNLDELHDEFTQFCPKAVFLSHISNVTGYVLPYEEIFSLSKSFGAVNVLDCAQSLGVLNPDKRNIDFAVFAGHKSLYASFGVAGFYDLSNYKLQIIKSGGTGSDSLNHFMPENGSQRYEAGSINSVAIAGLNESLNWLKANPPYNYEKEMTDYLISQLLTIDKVRLFLPKNHKRILGIVSISLDGYSSTDVGSILADDYNICVRTGFHCSPFVHDFIGSMGSQGTVRISISAFTRKDDIDYLIKAIRSL